MAKACCANKEEELQALGKSQKKVLWIVLAINFVMFIVEFSAGIYVNSHALLADSLDMLGDSLAYASSLYVINMGMNAKAKASVFKAFLMFSTGIFILVRSVYSFADTTVPSSVTISGIGFLALVMNALCLFLLMKHKNDDINFESVWLCSFNDIIANISVIIAGALVFYFNHRWPDLVVGFGIMILFILSSIKVFKDAKSYL